MFWFIPVMRKAKPKMCRCLRSVLEDSSLIQAAIPGCFSSLQWGGAELARDDFVSVFLEILDFDPKFQQKDEEENSHLPLGRNQDL